MDKIPHSKEYIAEKINEYTEGSIILKGKSFEGEWTVNELLYALESIMYINDDLNFSINEVSGIYIPCDRGPYLVPSTTRAEHIKIIGVESYDISATNSPKYLYLIIVKKVIKIDDLNN